MVAHPLIRKAATLTTVQETLAQATEATPPATRESYTGETDFRVHSGYSGY